MAAPAAADLVTSLLLLAIVANLALYVFMYPDRNIYDEHEIGPVLALGAALAGRQLGGPLLELRWRSLRKGLTAALAAGLACYAVMLGYAADRPQQAPANAAVAVWLTDHHLRRGLAEYWEASSVTVDTGGAVVIGSVGPDPGGLAPWHWEMDMRIFDPATRSANFVLSMPGDVVSPARATLAFGRPASTTSASTRSWSGTATSCGTSAARSRRPSQRPRQTSQGLSLSSGGLPSLLAVPAKRCPPSGARQAVPSWWRAGF